MTTHDAVMRALADHHHQRAMLSQPAQEEIARLEAERDEAAAYAARIRGLLSELATDVRLDERLAAYYGAAIEVLHTAPAPEHVLFVRGLEAAARARAERAEAQVAVLTARADRLRRRCRALLQQFRRVRDGERMAQHYREMEFEFSRRANLERDLWAAAWSGAITGDEFRAALGMDLVQWNDWRVAAAERGERLAKGGADEAV